MNTALFNKFTKLLDDNGILWNCAYYQGIFRSDGEIVLDRLSIREEPQTTYRIGQTFKFKPTGEIFMLVTHKGQPIDDERPAVQNCYIKDVSLIAIESRNKGACFCDITYDDDEKAKPFFCHVKDYYKITEEELDKICGTSRKDFELLEE